MGSDKIEKSVGFIHRLNKFVSMLILIELRFEDNFVASRVELFFLSLDSSKKLNIGNKFILSIADFHQL